MAYELFNQIIFDIALNTLKKMKENVGNMESFFGHRKDETDFKSCRTVEKVKQEVKSYRTYYNHYRGQWNLKRMMSAKY